ncbi:hypothetical protein COLU111180_06840 [Cohnella lubricantis]|uniref:Uncharacterized protein n=1 Tax=Cohnella lubricantis TaxID=2163172 RepID=A0A841TAY2_9BACL|nr:hypothetical protein [Cohnella lubricantis]MBB6678633.1 hypothetical protein [Cohnella lubricantis]MBP2119207.1 hypothetical protein [Cohnella lubricantis]
MRTVLMLVIYAAFAYLGCRKLDSGRRWREMSLFAGLIAYGAGIHLAFMRSWPVPTPTRLAESALLPAGRRVYSFLQSLL